MQVTETNDYSTHATIGTKKAQAFGIAQTAEFFRVLSSSLYSDQTLAVAREVLCNAWDAHISVDATNLAIKVTIDDEYLIIRDFGPGISDDRMVENYCTYGGGSTKLNDGKQTGGFSLGSKAPFAYTDHFEVTSWHKGRKTLYNLSLASLDADGLPAIQQIISLPTDETGLQVKIPLKKSDDHGTFASLIRFVASYGEMNVEINGQAVETVPFSKCPDGFLVLPASAKSYRIRSGLSVRYGSVVYPAGRHETYDQDYNWLMNFGGFRDEAIILQAPPNSIAVTPSRESLAMTDLTVNTIAKLVKDLRRKVENRMHSMYLDLTKKAVAICWLKPDRFGQIFDTTPGLPFLDRQFYDPQKAIRTVDKLIHSNFFMRFTTKSHETAQKGLQIRLEALMQSGYDTTNLARSLRRALLRGDLEKPGFNWFARNIAGPLINDMRPLKGFDPNRLMVLHMGHQGIKGTKAAQYATDNGWSSPLPFTRGLVLLGFSRQNITDRIQHFNELRGYYNVVRGYGPSVEPVLCYLVRREKADHFAEAQAFFEARGYRVINISARQPWDKVDPVIIERRPAVRKPKAFATLASIYDEGNYSSELIDTGYDIPRIDKPETVLSLSWKDTQTLDHFGNLSSMEAKHLDFLRERYGTSIALVTSKAQKDKAIAAGAQPFGDWLTNKLKKDFGKDHTLRKAFSIRWSLINSDLYDDSVILGLKLLLGDEQLSKDLKVHVALTKEQKEAYHFIDDISWAYTAKYTDDLLKTIFPKIGLHPAVLKLQNKLAELNFNLFFSVSNTAQLLRNNSEMYTDRNNAIRKAILAALKA